MDLQELHQKLQDIEKLNEEGKSLEAIALLEQVQKELKSHPVKDPNKQGLYNTIPKNICEKCGKEGKYEEQEDLCDFCYATKHNLGQGDASKSQREMDEERFDGFVKEYEELDG